MQSVKYRSAKAHPHVCIVGGGFGGLYSALTLSSLAGNQPLKITLVDPTERFVFLPLLYELAVGETALWEAALRIQPDSRFKHRIEFIGFVAGERTKWPNRAAASGWDHTSARV